MKEKFTKEYWLDLGLRIGACLIMLVLTVIAIGFMDKIVCPNLK